jgi:Ni/Fe-hydrogenase subunit HybB-like protein
MKPRITFWRVTTFLILALFAVGTYLRFTGGLARVTNLSDTFPWGLWVAFDILCGVGLAAGGFTVAAMVYLFGWERYRPVLRPAILTAFLGYLFVVFALLFDLGKPWNVWHPLIMHNPHSVMFEVGWCVMLYTTVLALEFAPSVWQKLRWGRGLRIWKRITVPLVLAGVLLSTLHQSSLGSLFLIMPQKMHPLWYSGLLPVLFFISAVGVGLAMVVVESYFSSRAFGRQIEWHLLSDFGKFMVLPMLLLAVIRGFDLFQSGGLALAFTPTREAALFWLEILLSLVAPLVLILGFGASDKPKLLLVTAFLSVGGFILYRINVAITAIDATVRSGYFPSFWEVMISLGVVTAGCVVFAAAVKYLPIYEDQPLVERWKRPVYVWDQSPAIQRETVS